VGIWKSRERSTSVLMTLCAFSVGMCRRVNQFSDWLVFWGFVFNRGGYFGWFRCQVNGIRARIFVNLPSWICARSCAK